MVQLFDGDVLTREVLDWKGVHLFHFHGSSCSQKTRVCLNLKGIEWKPHEIDLGNGENYTKYYLGINPRGLVPTLIINGEVHIESNDIITVLDERFPDHNLIPKGMATEITKLLHHEDDLHLDLRTISFRFTQPRGRVPRSAETLQKYREFGSGRVQGQVDKHKDRELEFWETTADIGITDDAVRISANRFRVAFGELDQKLEVSNYLLGESITVLDVAWIIYVNRLVRCGYPLERLHPNLNRWFWPLREKNEFDKELTVSLELQKAVNDHHQLQRETATTLIDVAGL